MKTIPFLFLAAFLATAAMAADPQGKIEITGQGMSASAPEYYSISVSVISMCYDTSIGAKNANADLANKIVRVLKPYKRGTKDKLIATGGANVRNTEYAYVSTRSPKVICERKWRATNFLTLQTEDKDKIADLQDAVLTAIDQVDDVRPDKTTQTYAQLSSPSFHVYPATERKLQRAAAIKAWEDAKAQFDVFSAQCKFLNPKLVSISRPQYMAVPHFADARALPSPGGSVKTPIMPDEMRVSATWNFVWSFTPGGSCFMLR